MARVVSPFGGGTLIGSIGSTAFQRHHSGNVAKTRTKPVDPRSEAQGAARRAMRLAARLWQDGLTDDERAAWNDYAQGTPILNDRGQTVHLNGRHHFTALVNANFKFNPTALPAPKAPATPGIEHALDPMYQIIPASGTVRWQAEKSDVDPFAIYLFYISGVKNGSTFFFKGPFPQFSGHIQPPAPPRTLHVFGAMLQGTVVFIRSLWISSSSGKLSRSRIDRIVVP